MLFITTTNHEKISIHTALWKSVPMKGQKCKVLQQMSLSLNPVSISVCNTSIEHKAKNLQLSPFVNKGSGCELVSQGEQQQDFGKTSGEMAHTTSQLDGKFEFRKDDINQGEAGRCRKSRQGRCLEQRLVPGLTATA